MELAKGWARVGAWVTVGAGAVAALLGASALSMLAAMAQRVAGKAMTREEMDREIARAILGRKRQPWQVTPQERAERKAAKAAKQAAREERKRMRREAYDRGTRDLRGYLMRWTRDRMRRAIAMLRSTRDGLPGAVAADDRADCERMIADARDAVRRWEFRYAIACAEAGAVPGGRVH